MLNLINLSSSDKISTKSNESLTSNTNLIPPAESEIDSKNYLKRAFVEYEEPRAAKKRRISHASVGNCKNTKSISKENDSIQHATNATEPKLQLNGNNSNRNKPVNTTKRGTRHKVAVLQTTFNDTQTADQEPAHSTTSAVSDNDQKKQHHEPILQKTSTVYEESPTQLSSISQTDTAASSYDFSWYSAITSIEQRRQYKADFEIDYEEYMPLLQRVEEVRFIFRVLPAQLQQVPEGSPEYKRIKDQIFLEYERLNSVEEIELKRRFDYLEAKLLHIKQLVDDFDEKWLTEKAVQAAVAAAKEYRL